MEPCCLPPPDESSSLFSVGIEGYQKILSPVLASQCYMFPSCSAYARQALAEYGPFLGLLLTIDRLFREADEEQTSPLLRQGDQFKLHDPPSANVWWK
ncbi:MAG: membrane protein insertion efficiency factor YidD [Deltaproteobacteria bacterium]|nr:membrane protein insertion efficiency factor YidD [Deltaproteobacteria bacterium]